MKLFGVNLAGADFGADGNTPRGVSLPGIVEEQYTYPTDLAEFEYYAKKGLTLFRIPFRWERVQRNFMDTLFSADIHSLRAVLNNVEQVKGKAILDMHNYARYYGTPLTKADVVKYADVWTKLATEFKEHPALYGYGLMNEPHDLPEGADGWNFLAQAVADAIHAVDPLHKIIVPGYDWQSADRWQQSNPNLAIKGANIVYDSHNYFDPNASGTYGESATDMQIGVTRVSHFIDWLVKNTYQGIVTEYGIPFNDVTWQPVLDKFLQTLNTTDAIIGGTAWAGGPWWGEYPLTVEPTNTYTLDRPTMNILSKYPSVGEVLPTPSPTPTPVPVDPAPIPIPRPTQSHNLAYSLGMFLIALGNWLIETFATK